MRLFYLNARCDAKCVRIMKCSSQSCEIISTRPVRERPSARSRYTTGSRSWASSWSMQFKIRAFIYTRIPASKLGPPRKPTQRSRCRIPPWHLKHWVHRSSQIANVKIEVPTTNGGASDLELHTCFRIQRNHILCNSINRNYVPCECDNQKICAKKINDVDNEIGET